MDDERDEDELERPAVSALEVALADLVRARMELEASRSEVNRLRHELVLRSDGRTDGTPEPARTPHRITDAQGRTWMPEPAPAWMSANRRWSPAESARYDAIVRERARARGYLAPVRELPPMPLELEP